jgi:hypothetical protein
MALDDVPLEDAGREYYAKQFDDRVRNIRKSGPSRSNGGRATGWAAGGGVVAALIAIRVIIAIVVAVSNSGSSDYNRYHGYQSPTQPITAPIDWNDNMTGEPRPWQIQQPDAADLPPDIPRPDDGPRIFDPDLPPGAPDGDRPNKDD